MFHQIPHVVRVVRLVSPYLVLTVVLVVVGAVDQLEGSAKQVFIGIVPHIFRGVYIFFINKLLDHGIQLIGIPKTQGVEQKIADVSAGSQNDNALVIILGPASCLNVVLPLVEVGILRHLIEHIGAHHGGHHGIGAVGGTQAQFFEGTIRMYLADGGVLQPVDLRRDAVGVFNGMGIFLYAAFPAVQVGLEGAQVIGIHGGEHIGDHLDHAYVPFFRI